MAQKWPKTAQIWFWCAHMVKTIGNYVWKNFQKFSAFFDRFWSIFIFSLKIHDFSKKNLKNSKKHFFDLWDLLWWVFHMVLALNHWFRPKNEGSKKSVPRNYKSAGSNALKKTSESLKDPRNGFFERISDVCFFFSFNVNPSTLWIRQIWKKKCISDCSNEKYKKMWQDEKQILFFKRQITSFWPCVCR